MGRGRRGDRPLRLRVRGVRRLPRRRAAGVRAADPAGLHALGVLRGAGRARPRRRQPRAAPRWDDARDGRVAGLPVRHGVPRARGARARAVRRPGGGARLRRRRAVRGDDRGGVRGARRGGGRDARRARGGARRGCRGGGRRERTGPGGGCRPRRRGDRGWGARVPRRARQPWHGGGVRARPAPTRTARPGGPAAGGPGTHTPADGPRGRLGARALRQPRDGRPRVPRDARARRERGASAGPSGSTRPGLRSRRWAALPVVRG